MNAPWQPVYDIAIVGSGYAGSLMAMIVRRLGLSVLLLERGSHPRVVIGESSTPLSNLLLEELALLYDLPRLLPLTKWGAWQQHYPELACGLKRGFTFHHHVPGKPQRSAEDRQDQLLVAASPHNSIADTHWYRADVDAFLVREAQSMGVQYLDRVHLNRFSPGEDVQSLEGLREGVDVCYRARFVIDASGPRGFLHRALRLREDLLPGMVATQALYNHFTGVERLENTAYARTAGSPPYPIDDAAVHHVFEGGWVWVLRFNNGVTSAGVVATDAVAETARLSEGNAAAWGRLLALIPALQAQFRDAAPQRPFTYLSKLSFSSSAVAGERWAMLPSAAGFVDPMLSTGFPLVLLGIGRVAEILKKHWRKPFFTEALQRYAEQTRAELDAASRLIGSLYKASGDFSCFASLSLLYFAAASYSETARRLARTELAPSFLLHDHPDFGPACRALYSKVGAVRSQSELRQLQKDVLHAIEPFDVAGLSDGARNNWHPARAEDLMQSAYKLGATVEQVKAMLAKCGFADTEKSAPREDCDGC